MLISLFFFSKGATSLSSLPASNAEDTPKYFWDSFDLNNPDASNIDNKNMNTELTANHPDNASFVSESSVGGDRSRLLLLQTTSASIIGQGEFFSFCFITFFSLSFSLLTPVQGVVLCQINIFCHQLTQNTTFDFEFLEQFV